METEWKDISKVLQILVTKVFTGRVYEIQDSECGQEMRYMVLSVTPMGSGLILRHGLIISADVYRRTDMHHNYMTLHHCIALYFLILFTV